MQPRVAQLSSMGRPIRPLCKWHRTGRGPSQCAGMSAYCWEGYKARAIESHTCHSSGPLTLRKCAGSCTSKVHVDAPSQLLPPLRYLPAPHQLPPVPPPPKGFPYFLWLSTTRPRAALIMGTRRQLGQLVGRSWKKTQLKRLPAVFMWSLVIWSLPVRSRALLGSPDMPVTQD